MIYTEVHTYADELIYTSEVVPIHSYVEKVYINKNLTYDDVLDILKSIDYELFNLNGFGEYTYFIMFVDTDSAISPFAIIKLGDVYGITFKGVPIFSSHIVTEMGIDFVGWRSTNLGDYENDYLNVNGTALSSFTLNSITFDIGLQNDKLGQLFSIIPYEVKYAPGDLISSEKVPFVFEGNLSFFDLSLEHTTKTFSNFNIPFLKDSFNKLFNLLGLETGVFNSFISSTFTWMLQLMLLHIIVDTFGFIFKLYHKLMEKVV